MKIFRKLNTVFYKLIISYIVLTLITIIFVGITSYLYFSSSFNDQIEKVNQRMLAHLSQTIDNNIIEKVEKSYLELVTDDLQHNPARHLFDNSINDDHSKINETYQQLQAIVSTNSNILDSISIFYKSNNIVISSASGITYLDQTSTVDLEWLERSTMPNKDTLWIEARQVTPNLLSDSYVSDLVSFVRPYPYTSNKSKIKAYIAIHIKEAAFHQIVQSTDPSNESEFFLMNEEGGLLTHSNHAALYTGVSESIYVKEILKFDKISDNYIDHIQGIATMISYITIPSVKWKLVNTTPVDVFFKNTTPIRNTLILICIVAIIIGLIISNIFTMNMYNPIKSLIHSARHLFGSQQTQHDIPENEFKFINNVLNNLSVKVNTLETTLVTNMPLIKHNLVVGLIHNTIISEDELQARLKMLKIGLTESNFYALTFHLDFDQMKNLTIENSQFIKYNLMNYLEEYSLPGIILLSIELSEQEVCAILCIRNNNIREIIKLIEEVINHIYSNFMINMVAVVGTRVDSPLDIHQSFKMSQKFHKYHYFMPEEKIIYGEHLLARENSTEEIPDRILEQFSSSLRTNDIQIIKEEIRNIVQLLKNGNFSVEHCHQRWRDMIAIFRGYIKDLHLKTNEIIDSSLLERFKDIRNISHFELWLIHSIEASIRNMEYQHMNKNSETIQMVKNYILANTDSPLSLDTAAEIVFLSPRYLSKVFKEEMGMNFTDFVTKTRIEKASELIIATNLTIEQIAVKSGFNSSAYFIKKFKESYGITPKNYKHNYFTSTNKRRL